MDISDHLTYSCLAAILIVGGGKSVVAAGMKTTLPYADFALERRARWPRLVDGWQLVALAVAAAVALPVLVVLASLLAPSGEIWAHLAGTVLWDYLWSTPR